jgi:hypothetical protein
MRLTGGTRRWRIGSRFPKIYSWSSPPLAPRSTERTTASRLGPNVKLR